jgi:hypothetical protein
VREILLDGHVHIKHRIKCFVGVTKTTSADQIYNLISALDYRSLT